MFTSVFSMLPLVSADSGTIEQFSDLSYDIELQTDSQNPVSVDLTIQRNTTIHDASFQITYDDQDPSPGEFIFDIDEDGMYEWHLGGLGYGSLGEQTTFSNGASSTSAGVNGNLSWGATGTWRLPTLASMSVTDITVGFTPTLASQFSNLGTISDLVVGDMDGDGNEDGVYLVTDRVGMNGTAWPHIGWMRWDSTTSSMQTSWFATCEGASRIIIGDVNGDGNSDVLSIAQDDLTLCQHLSGSSAWSHSANLTMGSQFSDAILVDLDGDSQDDVATIDIDGTLSAYLFSAGSFSGTAITTSVPSGNQMPGSMDFASLAAGEFFGTNTSIAISEAGMMANYNTLWNFTNNNWDLSTQNFECIGGMIQVTDWNADGYDDLIGTTTNGGCMATWNGTAWLTSNIQIAGLSNFTVGDHDRDGDVNLFRTLTGTVDGSDSTFTGSVESHDFDGSGGIYSNSSSLTPYTAPRDIVLADMNGDGLDEQLVVGGESALGLWVGAWHTVEWDLEGDGIVEMLLEGYEDSTSPLSVSDMGTLISSVNSELLNANTGFDFYDTSWSDMEPVARSRSAGTITQSDLNMTYAATFTVETNPSNGNLSNVLNDHMELGTGDLIIPLNFSTTRDGTVTLGTLQIDWTSGASNIEIPAAPTISLIDYNHSQVTLMWTNSTSQEDLIGYELFRAPAGTQISTLQPPHASVNFNGYMDTDAVTNADWDYAVRSVHNFGIFSPLSNILMVSVPDVPPVIDTTPPDAPIVSLTDVPNDNGDALLLSWTPSTSNDVAYTLLYFETTAFTDASALTPIANVSVNDPTTPMVMNGLTTGTDYWAAAVAVDADNNALWTVTAVGPITPLNNSVRSSTLSLSISAAGLMDDNEHTQSLGFNGAPYAMSGSPLDFTIQLTTEGWPMVGETVTISMFCGVMSTCDASSNVPEHTFDIVTDATGTASIGWTNWLEFVTQYGAYGGVFDLEATWDGGTYQGQTVIASNQSEVLVVKVAATLSTSTPSIQLDANGTGTATVSVETLSALEQSVIYGLDTEISTKIESTGVETSTNWHSVDMNGVADIPVNWLSSGQLNSSCECGWFIDVSPMNLYITLESTPEPEPEPEPEPDPELMWITVVCDEGDWNIHGNSTIVQGDLESYTMHCTLTNPNNVTAQLTFNIEDSQSNPGFTNDLTGTNIWLSNNSSLDFTLSPNSWAEGTTPSNGTITVSVSMTAIDWVGTQDSWILPYGFTTITDDETDTVEQTTDGTEEDAGLGMLPIIGMIVALLAVVGIFGMRAMMKESDEEDDEDDDWYQEDKPSTREKVNIPSGRSLEELTTKGSSVATVVESPDIRTPGFRPTPIKEFVTEQVEEEEVYEEEGESDYTQDADYHVDDDGVEWWKDEVGQWWYRYPDEEEWEAFES
ncbi:MAG: VCBS repeat-containing protein [Candidatus Thermoplasmatota archaeon]|nr:VCBS repeat-containing protein [Candidatus Thermoplasmatota archaeon]